MRLAKAELKISQTSIECLVGIRDNGTQSVTLTLGDVELARFYGTYTMGHSMGEATPDRPPVWVYSRTSAPNEQRVFTSCDEVIVAVCQHIGEPELRNAIRAAIVVASR